ncbi:unnamed protein product [Cuscuta epithymum]|uniref:SWIM-type domain-containing protein n=1 Tax=Cuscuta epithymum TaxID=186058 RepID=A0AAV0D1L6_9ASTE|nr:unnamed protein product [Cuscuta epithymum]
MFQIRRFDSTHTCPVDFRQGKHRQATYRTVAELVSHKFLDASRKPYAPNQIRDDMSFMHGISMSYKKAWKAQKIAMQKQFGSDSESYQILPSMAYMLADANPNSVISLVTDDDDVFRYFFMSLAPWRQAWLFCRPILILDGSFLKAYYKGTLLTACAQDANDHIVPLAFGVCDSESKASWLWFLSKVSESLTFRDDLYILSDRNEGLLSAAKEIFPHASHGYCVEHLRRNMVSKFKGSAVDLGWKFKAAYKAATLKEFEEYMCLLDSQDVRIRPWLEKVGTHKWAKCMCGPSRYDVMTSNCAESMNNVNAAAREYCIAKLLDFIRERMQQWFVKRKEKAEKTQTILTNKHEKHLVALQSQAAKLKVKPASYFEFEVVDRHCRSFVVDLQARTCTCAEFQLNHFVCVHGVAAIGICPRVSCYDYISPYYTRDYWLSTWTGVMHPIRDRESWLVPSHISSIRCKPPSCSKRPPGRPRKSRIPSIGEHRGTKRSKCSRCHTLGHNKKTCRNPIPATSH